MEWFVNFWVVCRQWWAFWAIKSRVLWFLISWLVNQPPDSRERSWSYPGFKTAYRIYRLPNTKREELLGPPKKINPKKTPTSQPFAAYQKVANNKGSMLWIVREAQIQDFLMFQVTRKGKCTKYHGSYRILKVDIGFNECCYLKYLLGGSSQLVSVYRITPRW